MHTCSPLYSVCSMCTDVQQDTPRTLEQTRTLLITETDVCTHTVYRVQRVASLCWKRLTVTYLLAALHCNVKMLCWSTLCNLEFQYVNDSSEGDTACWTGILCSRRPPEEGTPVSKHVAFWYLSWIVFCDMYFTVIYGVCMLVDVLNVRMGMVWVT